MKTILILLMIISSIYANTYQKFSSNIKFISDSKIYKKSNNLLTSNAPIYGQFYSSAFLQQFLNNGISNIKCNKQKRLYKVVNDCYMYVTKDDIRYMDKYNRNTTDVLYLGEMDSKDISDFDYRSHMIECKYDKKHGLLHNCQVKIYKKIFD